MGWYQYIYTSRTFTWGVKYRDICSEKRIEHCQFALKHNTLGKCDDDSFIYKFMVESSLACYVHGYDDLPLQNTPNAFWLYLITTEQIKTKPTPNRHW